MTLRHRRTLLPSVEVSTPGQLQAQTPTAGDGLLARLTLGVGLIKDHQTNGSRQSRRGEESPDGGSSGPRRRRDGPQGERSVPPRLRVDLDEGSSFEVPDGENRGYRGRNRTYAMTRSARVCLEDCTVILETLEAGH
jgi:hypothetical protein